MDWKQFLASIIGALAWPVAAVIIVYIFKDQLRLLIGHVRKIGAAGVNVELSEKVEAAEEAGELVQAEKGIAAPDIAGIDPAILEMVRSFPEAALIQSFRDLENLILQIRERLPDGRPHRTLPEVLKALERLELIPSSAFALFQSVREARNAAVRGKGEKLTSAEALSLIGQIKLLQGVLAPVLDQLPAKSTVPS